MTKTYLRWLLVVSAFSTGFAEQKAPHDIAALLGLTNWALSSLWLYWLFWLDTTQRGYPRPLALRRAVLAMSALVIPFYFYKTRGLWKGIWAIGRALGMILLIMMAYVIGVLTAQLA